MEEIKTTVKKWGNSYGIVVPVNVVKKENLQEGSQVEITVHSLRKTNVNDIFGLAREHKLKIMKKSTKELLEEANKAFEPGEH